MNELNNIIKAVVETGTDESIDALSGYYDQHPESVREVFDALKTAAEKGSMMAKFYFAYESLWVETLTEEDKELAIRYGEESGDFGYAHGYWAAATMLGRPEFRPRDYFYHSRSGLLARHRLNEPDYALRRQADDYQKIVDKFGDMAKEDRIVCRAATLAAQLYLSEKGFGPRIPIEDWYEETGVKDLDFAIECSTDYECLGFALSLKGAYLLSKRKDGEAADCFIQALEADPDAVFHFCFEHMQDRQAHERVLAACEAARDRMSPKGLKGLEAFPYCQG